MSPNTLVTQLRSRAESGDSAAMLKLANWLHAEADLEDEAMVWWRRAAAVGESDAAFNLGSMLEDDDPKAALAWYEQAATAGHLEAKVNAGALLAEQGVFERAIIWWDSAARDGDADAMYNLGQLADRQGRAEDAEHWWLQAMQQGVEEALENLAAQCEDLHRAEDPRAASLANLVLATLAEVGLQAPPPIRRSLQRLAVPGTTGD